MAKPEKPKPGCFSGFLRVILCAGNGTSPPVHPSDETELVHPNKDDAMVEDAATPGLVARLMGLDSLPKTNLVMKGATPNSVPRSRSVNFVDYLLDFDTNQANHRRVKTSASFREVPKLGHSQNHDLLVLYLGDGASKDQEEGHVSWRQGKKQGSKKNEVVREKVYVKKERNQGKNKKISKLKNEPRRVPSCKRGKKVRTRGEAEDLSSVSSSSEGCSYRCSGARSSSSSRSPLPNKQKKGFVEPKLGKNKINQQSPKKIETECSSENLSPVSVLDFNDYPFLHEIDFLDGTSPLASKSKCKSSLLQSLGGGVEERASTNKGCSYTDVNREAEYYSELMLKLRTLTEKDLRESGCTPKHTYDNEGFEEICLVFEHKILDVLLDEFVNEVVELSS